MNARGSMPTVSKKFGCDLRGTSALGFKPRLFRSSSSVPLSRKGSQENNCPSSLSPIPPPSPYTPFYTTSS